MTPLAFANIGEKAKIKRIGGSGAVRSHLKSLGFVAGETIKVISTARGNLIVNIKESRIAMSEEMAFKIMIYNDTLEEE